MRSSAYNQTKIKYFRITSASDFIDFYYQYPVAEEGLRRIRNNLI